MGQLAGQEETSFGVLGYTNYAEYMGGLGFRDIELFNLALLARQVWRILQSPDSLGARILNVMYFPKTYIMHASLGSIIGRGESHGGGEDQPRLRLAGKNLLFFGGLGRD